MTVGQEIGSRVSARKKDRVTQSVTCTAIRADWKRKALDDCRRRPRPRSRPADEGIPVTPYLIQRRTLALLAFLAGLLPTQDATKALLDSHQELLVAQRPAGALALAQAPQFLLAHGAA